MGLFSRFYVQALRFTAHSASKTRVNALAEALRRVGDAPYRSFDALTANRNQLQPIALVGLFHQ
jgi:hypothetical protein